MLGFDSTSYASLTDEQRKTLLDLVRAKDDYMEVGRELNKLRAAALLNPCQKTQEAMENYASAVVAPKRLRVAELQMSLVTGAVSIEKLQSMLPMVALALTQSINLPLLMAALDFDPDVTQKALTDLSAFFKKGMEAK
jgi:hypothetical protein